MSYDTQPCNKLHAKITEEMYYTPSSPIRENGAPLFFIFYF